jgi:hypothetical protein
MNWRAILSLGALSAVLAACATGGAPAGQDVRQRAAAEATALIQQAEATALVLQAQAMATAIVAGADAGVTSPVRAGAPPSPAPTAALGRPTAAPTPEVSADAAVLPTAGAEQVEVVRVGFAAEGGLIIVQFRAPPEVAKKWWQGQMSVVDEATGEIYNEVPVLPVVGPLIGRPSQAGQIGHVMFVNAPSSLQPGALVTVVLGDFKQEHVVVEP